MDKVGATSFTEATPADWEIAVRQGRQRYIADAGAAALNLLKSQKDEPSNGWQVNNYEHSLSAATKALRNGEDEEYVVAVLLHDLAQDLDPMRHDRVAGTLMKPFLRPENHWMVANHQVFQLSFRTHSKFDTKACEKFRGHPFFEHTLRFCDLYDQSCFDPNAERLPIETFDPMVRRVFGRVMQARMASYP